MGGSFVSALLALVVSSRPLHIDAILLHSHGDEGLHAHALVLASGESLEHRHLQVHDSEHGCGSHDPADDTELHDTHSEDCSPLVINFGESQFASASSRVAVGAHDPVAIGDDQCPAVTASCALQSAAVPRACRVPFVRQCCALDAILNSSSALLI